MDLLDIIREAGKSASRVGNNLMLGELINAYGKTSSNNYAFAKRTLSSPQLRGTETIPTPNSSFVNNVVIDHDNATSIVTMDTGATYRYSPQTKNELEEIRTYARNTGHFGKEYWTHKYERFYDKTARAEGRPSRNRI